jgi:hypothetical protein
VSDDIDYFLHINRMTFERQDMGLPYRRELVRRLDAACVARDCRLILIGEDDTGRPQAVLYLIWDSESAYYLMGGADPALRTSGAMSLLMWEAIKHAARVTKAFDFEGSMIEPIERFFRAFGPRQTPYMHLFRTRSLKGRVAALGRDVFRDAARRIMRYG